MNNHRDGTAKRWCFTINNFQVEERELVKDVINTECEAGVAGEEKGKEGTPHIQGFFWFYRPIRLTGLKKKFPRAHFEKANGNWTQNKDYCTKEGNVIILKEPERDLDNLSPRKNQWKRISELCREENRDQIQEEFPREWAVYRTAIERIIADFKIKSATIYNGDLKLKNYWIWGATGTGKSKWATLQVENPWQLYRKMANKWWDGYSNRHKVVVIEDWPQLSQLDMGHHMKLWSDRYDFPVEIKGSYGQVPGNTPIIVTSNYCIDRCFKEEDIEPIKRRFTEIHLCEKNKEEFNNLRIFKILKGEQELPIWAI